MLRSFVIGLSFLLFQSLSAQNNELGIRISYNTTENENEVSTSGATLTGYYTVKLGEKFALEPSIQYRAQSFKDNVLEEYQNVDVEYFSIPIALRYYPMNSKPFNDLYTFVGLQADLVIDAEIEDPSTGIRQDAHNIFNYVNGGYYYGLGYNIKQKVDVQLRWYQGLGNNYIEPQVSQTLDKNSFFEISMAFILFTE